MSYEDRCQISALLKRNFSILQIAKELGFHRSTIYREIKRHWGLSDFGLIPGYFPRAAQRKSKQSAKKRVKKKIITGELELLVINKLKKGWSPEIIAGRLKYEKNKSLSHQTIYDFINENKSLKKYLRFGSKRGNGRLSQRKRAQETLPSIHSRPIGANDRSVWGHWERDGMYGANRKQVLVCLERKSRLVRLKKMDYSNAKYVHELTAEMLKEEKVLSITNDNGSEFRKPHLSRYPLYYCDPLKPQQRGSVENVIGSLRRFIKRETDLEMLGNKGLEEIECCINLTPRKIFDYKTPYEVHHGKSVALVI